ncbi:MAG: ABC-F family ATP-binding cassette domain-containing protein [Candidatus Eisenbacteria sp.]|nr:ABC-F family ATP-binding cassette domain-containing protein [Candidatus Eisenbacteria bacterium]
MLSFKDISLRFAGIPILNEISGSIERGERIGLVGPNGAGKTTLLRVMTGEESPENGELRKPNFLRVGYLPQGGVEGSSKTCLEEALEAYGDLAKMEDEITGITRRLSEIPEGEPVPENLLARYGELEHRFAHRGGYEGESAVLKVLDGLGIGRSHWNKATSDLSGGQRMRLALAKLILLDHELLFLDEPTNHLDIRAIEWLEGYLSASPAGQIIVSHDRRFLDRLVSEIWELNHGALTKYRGDYSFYLEAREERIELQKKRRAAVLEERRRLQDFIDRNRSRKDRAKQVQGRIKVLRKLEEAPLPPELAESTFRLKESAAGDRIVAKMENVGKSYGGNVVFQGLELTIERGDRIAVLGPNGAGKSTLLKILMGREQATEGSCWTSRRNVVRSYSQDQAECLGGRKTVLAEVEGAASVEMVPQVRSLLARFLFCDDDVFKPLDALSGGERSRLALAKLMVEAANFLVLDEPTNHLDQDGQAVLTAAIERYGGTLIFVSHDRYFIDRLANRVLEIDGGRVRLFLGNYSDYRHVLKREAEDAREAKVAVCENPPPRKERRPTGGLSPAKSREREKKLKKIEQEIETLEARIKTLDVMLSSPAVFQSGNLSRDVVEEQRVLRGKLPGLYEQWETLTEEEPEKS